MKIYVEANGNNCNYISFNKFNFLSIPYLSIYNYFLISRENCYFLILSLIQLSTYSKIGFLPSEWSPSGPFSTAIPLILCYFLELFGLIILYFTDLIKTYKYNHVKKVTKLDKGLYINIKFKDIKIGDFLLINKGDIFPVDGLIVDVYSEKYGKINLSNLNGECDIICKESLKKLKNSIDDIKILNIEDHSNSIKKFNCTAILDKKHYQLNHEYFVPGGAINSGNDKVLFLVTQVGKNIRSYSSLSTKKIFKDNFINNFISRGLLAYFVPLLTIFCFSLVYFSIRYSTNIGLLFILEKIIQSWILLNGIVPFSIKLLLIINRNIQSYVYSNNNIEYINNTSAENISSIKRFICDKTGTITKNQLLLTHLSYKDEILCESDISNKFPFEYLYNIVFGLHIKDNIYNTEEDKVIGHKILSLGTIIQYNGNSVTIFDENNKINMKILEMSKLEFDCNRKLSSVIFRTQNNDTYIVTKGSIDSIRKLIKNEEISRYNNIVDKYNNELPYLRTIAFAYKKIENYDLSVDPFNYEISGNFEFISILGIQDELQENITSTIQYLHFGNKKISICTGDRRETALYIASKIGILKDNYFSFDQNVKEYDIKNKTFIFSSLDISNSVGNYNSIEKFKNYLLNCNNFVSYSLMPKDKQFITSIFEANNNNIIAVGDGTNDIPMLNSSTVAIGVNNGLNNNVINNSHISIKRFQDLIRVTNDTENFNNINLRTAYFIYYKTLLINSLIYFFILYNKLDFKNILFSFIEIQGQHLLWGLIPILTSNFIKIRPIDKNYIIKTASLTGILNSLFIFYLIDNYVFVNASAKIIILLFSIISINIQFIIVYGIHKLNIFSTIISLFLGLLYVFSTSNITPNVF